VLQLREEIFECCKEDAKIRGGTQKFPEFKKKYLNYLYKFETLVPFEVLPPATGCNNPSTVPNGNDVKGRQ
jgi:hypothetical protein